MRAAASEMITELKAEPLELLERADAAPSVQEQLQSLKQAFEELKPSLDAESRDEWRALFKLTSGLLREDRCPAPSP